MTFASVSAARTARARPTAPGVSPCRQIDETGIASTVPSTATTCADVAIRRARSTTSSDDVISASGSDRGTREPSLRYARSAKPSPTAQQSGVVRGAQQRGRGKPENRESDRVFGHRGDDRLRLCGIPDGTVVERTVRLHIGDPGAGHARDAVERRDLVDHLVAQLVGVVLDSAPTEAGQIAVGDLRADRDAVGGRRDADATHRDRIAGVEATRHVRRGHDTEERLVVAETPSAEAFAEIRVQVHHVTPSQNRTLSPGRTCASRKTSAWSTTAITG